MERVRIKFECTVCKNRNYTSTKNKKTTSSQLAVRKYCPHCRSHQVHKEVK